MSKQPEISPFKFLDSYAKEDKDIFFGRHQEVSEIHAKIYQSKLLLVYGASGTGKSSIVNCGLANKLDETDWLPVHIRRGGDISRAMMQQLIKQTTYDIDFTQEQDTESFHKVLHTVVSNVFLDHFKPIYLIFDQFEELFIFGYKEEWLRFIKAVRYLMDTDLDVHFMFIIRGEYLEFLSEFEEIIPEFFDNRIRIEKMTRKMAKESITGPSQLASIQLENDFEENLLKKLSPDKSQIELTFLQVILDKIYRSSAARIGDGEQLTFTNEDIEEVGQIGDILAEFVDEQLFKMPDSKAALTVLKGFVSLEGTKNQRNLEEIVSYCEDIGQPQASDKVEAIISSFVNKRILKDKDDNDRYELRHDSLAQKIFEKITNQEKEILEVRRFIAYNLEEHQKRQSILNDDDLSYIAPYERLLNLNEEQKSFIELSKKRSSKRRKAQRTRSIIIAIISLLMITSVIGFYISRQQRARAENLAAIAAAESDRAKAAQVIAEEQSDLAANNAKEASRQATIAQQEADKALLARDQAKVQEQEALRQKTIADNQRMIAEEAQLIALTNEEEANLQRQTAEERRLEAEKLRNLALAREIALKAIYTLDNDQKALLSKFAFDLNKQYGGDKFAPNVYRSLYLSNKALFGENYNAALFPGKEIIGLIQVDQAPLVISSDGNLSKITWQNNVAGTTELLSSGQRLASLDFLDAANEIILGTRNGNIIILNAAGEQVATIDLEDNSPVVKTIYGKNGDKIVGLRNGSLAALNSQGQITRSSELAYRINDLVALDNKYLIATEEGQLLVLNAALEELKTATIKANIGINRITPVAGTAELILGMESGEIFRYNLNTEVVLATLIGHTAAITDLEITESGQYLISSSFDRSVRLWNLGNRRSQSILLSEHERWATAVAINEEFNYAYSTSYGGKVRRYPLNIDELETGLCAAVGRSLTRDEWSEFIGNTVTYKELCK